MLKNLFDRFLFVSLIIVFFTSVLAAASPAITINSPQNITYNVTKILVNVTSSEPVDFFMEGPRGKRLILGTNTTSYNSFVYVKTGSYNYVIHANNSNGETEESVQFGTTMHNPIEVDSCGTLSSSDTKYVVTNDLTPSWHKCLSIWEIRNSSIDLNGHTVNSGKYYAIELRFSSGVEVFNGTVKGSPYSTRGRLPWLFVLEGTKLKLKDLKVDGHVGFSVWSLRDSIFENVKINSTAAFFYGPMSEVHIINSTISWNGFNNVGGASDPVHAAFWDQSDNSEIFLEETNITGFPIYEFYFESSFADFYLRNSNINRSKAIYSPFTADVRYFLQHLILINVSDQFNKTGSGTIKVQDNKLLRRKKGLNFMTETVANPTADVLIASDEHGTARTWLTEKLVYAKTSSPVVFKGYDFSPYTLIAKAWNSSANASLDLGVVNSTVPVSFKLVVPRKLPKCTLEEMLDLNNDGEVNIQDAVFILRQVAGLSVSDVGVKGCEGINLALS